MAPYLIISRRFQVKYLLNIDIIAMKFLFCGLGSIGKRHVENIKNIIDCEVFALKRKNYKEDDFVKKYKIEIFFDLDKALQSMPDAVFITNPTNFHIPHALKAAKHNCHLFIEKPLSNNMDGVEKLIHLAKKNNLIGMIGCNLRFHPSLRLIKKMLEENWIGKVISIRAQAGQYLPDWHPGQDYRIGYSANKNFGGGVVLDLIHELDYLYWFFGEVKEVFAFIDKSSNLEINSEDTAEILLRFRNNIIGEVHLDYVQRTPSRSCQIIAEEGTIIWDYYKGEVKVYRITNNSWKTFNLKKEFNLNQMYVDEIRHFINCLKGKKLPFPNISAGADVLKIALAAKKSSEMGKLASIVC